jgi:hypothetical protein
MNVESVAYPDKLEDFLKWVETFKKKYGGWYPHDIKGWYNRVEKSHASIRNTLLGDKVRKEFIFDLKSQQNPISAEDAEPHINEILKIVPDYLIDYKFQKDAFLKPIVQDGTHNAYKVSKHVRTYAEKVYHHSPEKNAVLKPLDKALAQLGELWKKARSSDTQLEATISTSPRAFLLLGHYRPDVDSCFRQGSDKTKDKYALGQTPNTFVVSIASKHPTQDRLQNVARCYGWTNDNTVFNTANYYFVKGFQEGDGIEVLKRIFQSLTGNPMDMYEERQYMYDDKLYDPARHVFHNTYARWTFVKQGAGVPGIQLFSPVLDLVKKFKCPNCGRDSGGDDRNWHEVDDMYLCSRCIEGAFRCELTDTLTFRPPVPLLNEEGFEIKVHPKVASEYARCQACSRHHIVSIKTPDDRTLCSECFEVEFTECEACHTPTKEDCLLNIGDRELCIECFEKGELPFEEHIVSLG